MTGVRLLRGLLDEHGSFTEPLDVVVVDGTIDRIGEGLGSGLPAFDASERWLMPGIADCHAHLGCFTDSTDEILAMSVTRWVMEVSRNAALLLDMGITLIRDPATSDAGIRDGVHSGGVAGTSAPLVGALVPY